MVRPFRSFPFYAAIFAYPAGSVKPADLPADLPCRDFPLNSALIGSTVTLTMMQTCPIASIVKRDGAPVRYDRGRISTAIFKALRSVGRADLGLSESLAEQVERTLVAAYSGTMGPTVEDIQDVAENVLMENGLTDVARSYIIYRHERALLRSARAYSFEIADYVPYRKIYDVLRWNTEHGCDSVRGLNRIVRNGDFPAFVLGVDRRYQEEVDLAAQGIARGMDRIRIVIVAGPSSSGKTTTTLEIGRRLKQRGCRLKTLNLDHYFFDLERHPKDEFGDYDYETPQALDLELIDRHLSLLIAGNTVRTPHYNFTTGRSTPNAHELRLDDDELLLLDSLHGLHDALTGRIPAEKKYKVYVETLGQIKGSDGTLMRWADNRLLRRMQRDRQFRNLQPMETLTHWHYVRRSELKNIIPFIHTADCIVNTALPYELPILKAKLFPYITRARRLYGQSPERRDAYLRAARVHDFLKLLKPVRDDACVPPTSLLREFIGGGEYGRQGR